MKSPICIEELKNGHFCPVCAAKIKQGIVSELDLEVMRKLEALDKTLALANTEFIKAFEAGDFILVVCSGNIGPLIGKGGAVVKELSSKLSKKVRIVEKSGTNKKTVQDLLGNVRVLGVNRVFRPDAKEVKVLVAKEDQKKMIASKETLENIISEINSEKTEINFI